MNGSKKIYIACPWGPHGGGMFKVADYLIQGQALQVPDGGPRLVPLDTRGAMGAGFSLVALTVALGRILFGKLTGGLIGVHVNMAERMSLFRKCCVVVWCRLIGMPVVLHLHAAQLHHFYRKLPRPLQGLVRWSFGRATTCIVLGQAARQFVVEELHVDPSKVEIVINGVPSPAHTRRQRSEGAPYRVVFLGNLSERKGVSDLLRAMAEPGWETRNVEVTFAGGGDVAGYERRARELSVEHLVKFVGWADQAKASSLLAQADVLVLPSYDEGLPLVILEALAHGVAVVCTPVGEIPTVFTDGKNACLVEPGNAASIAAGLRKVIDAPAFREQLEGNGKAMYDAQFSMAHFFTSIAKIHARCFGAGARYHASVSRAEAQEPAP